VLVFPEGKHTTDGKMNPFRAGIGLLAANLAFQYCHEDRRIVELKQAGRRFAPPGKILVRIGEPMKFESGV